MGRHRRSAAAPAAESHAEGNAGQNPGARRKKRVGMPVRTGLLGLSAALAVGGVAVASGLLPGGDNYKVSGGPAADHVRSDGAPDLLTQGGSTTAPADRGSAPATAGRGTERAKAPTKSASPEAGTPSASPSRTSEPTKTKAAAAKEQARRTAAAKASASAKAPTASKTAPAARTTKSSAPASASSPARTAKPTTKPSASAPAAGKTTAPAVATSAQAAVLALVNQERATVGCSPVTASSSLASLAQNFSDDMASRGFFDHTDPDGKSPWDRASAAGVSGLGGENIARGQADAAAVMEAWMNSEGHRANILNCDYKTLGVGVHFGSGGPWWTQDFGF
ncbi:CAP domain-containing protein [Streptomyces sp. NPDC005795]|uniref:CAP domain-containing protein n=1 Tax=Streptomyces sp. NPDC005795 TaxID=3154677 RepID=UPI0033E7F317